jgi:hypothetical protein
MGSQTGSQTAPTSSAIRLVSSSLVMRLVCSSMATHSGSQKVLTLSAIRLVSSSLVMRLVSSSSVMRLVC